MKRRTLLRGLSAAGALAATGCLSDGADGPAGDSDARTDTDADAPTDGPAATPTDRPGDTVTDPGGATTETPSDAPTDAASETPDGGPSGTPGGVVEQSLTVTASGCGQSDDEVSVSFDADAGTVTVSGTIWGSNACYTAVLSDVSLHQGTLTVVVASESDAGTDMACAMCITEITYEATVELAGGLPETVTVVHEHDGERTAVRTVPR